jgi:FKBP-type peptidyl-prolyl cis-trans isomerase FkpA
MMNACLWIVIVNAKKTEVKRTVYLFSFLFVLSLNFSCLKGTDSCTQKSPASEAGAMNAYCAANGITPTAHSSGLFYQILDPGTGATPSATSKVFITYVGKLTDGTVFDQQSNASATGFPLNQLIEGWKVGIPLIKEGGHILLVVPSSMGYGCSGYGIIPANAVLFFDVTLVDVQ